jgi:uncharacterized protein (TIGR02599 family)
VARCGFTLVEILVSTAVLSLLMVILLGVTVQMGEIWRKTTGKIEQFRGARDAFESMTRRLSQATLNTYWDYDNPTTPTRYIRQSELRFLSGKTETLVGKPTSPNRWPTHCVFFQAPFGFVEATQTGAQGLGNLLNTWGYFIEFGNDDAERPSIFGAQIGASRYRYRLHEFMQPANSFNLYDYTSGMLAGSPRNLTYNGHEWFTTAMNLPLPPNTAPNRPTHILADNIVALIFLPKLATKDDSTGTALCPTYGYDSTATNSTALLNPKNQLPPLMQVTLVAIDETSAKRMENGTTMPELGLDTLFTDATQMSANLRTLEQTLISKNSNYRIFTTNVSLNGAKWSRDQKN